MKKIKIYGAGSIGNHHAHAARTLGWQVDICDNDPKALERTKSMIYPERYGKWDKAIGLFTTNSVPKNIYDYIIIGTPPKTHIKIALDCLKEKPKAILIEKPLCDPSLKNANLLYKLSKKDRVPVFVGYDHAVSKAAIEFAKLLKKGLVGKLMTLDVEFREFWGGIFSAHPWLSGPKDSYLGYWKKGGGSTSEHSHAINLFQYLAGQSQLGKVTEISAKLQYVKNKHIDYDAIALINLKTQRGIIGRVVQDVITEPKRKWVRAQGTKGSIELECGIDGNNDMITLAQKNKKEVKIIIKKSRPDDFIEELRHMDSVVSKEIKESPILLQEALDTMLIIAGVHKSAKKNRTISLDYSRGYNKKAIK